MIKKIEHFWKGLSSDKTQISALPPEQYGDRFLNFMEGITVSREEAERIAQEKERAAAEEVAENERQRVPSWNSMSRRSTSNSLPSAPTHQPPAPPARSPGTRSPEADETLRRAEHQAIKAEKHGHTEQGVPERVIRTSGTALSGILPSVATAAAPSLMASNGQGPNATTLTLETVEETGEGSMNGGRDHSGSRISSLTAEHEVRPPTPAKDGYEQASGFTNPSLSHVREPSRAPPTPPKTAGGLVSNGVSHGKRLTKPESADSGIGVHIGRARSGSQVSQGSGKQAVKGQLSRDSLEKALPPLPAADGCAR